MTNKALLCYGNDKILCYFIDVIEPKIISLVGGYDWALYEDIYAVNWTRY
jgi:hypothetical protein